MSGSRSTYLIDPTASTPVVFPDRSCGAKVPAYTEFAKAELGEQVAIYLRPQRWLSADLGAS